MKVKEIERTANIAWSPAAQHPVYVAAGTAAQQLDATFSTSAALELYQLDLGESGMEMEMAGSIASDFRFHKLVWGSYGMETDDKPSGLLMGGTDNGNVFVWNPANIIKKEDALVHKLDKHSGAVAALDINPFQNNLLASGGSESEIYIWDLTNPTSPMTPGAKSQPPDDVTCIAWNRQVQHILASTYAGRCVVWDLRKNEPIIKVSDSMARIKCKLVSWHPEVATQMCLASEDDHTPVIQLWDLRFATSPLKQLESHQRGILSMAWCPQDPDLLLSCAKDNRILCWNPNSQAPAGEVVYELPTSNQWSFDVQWCPRNPAMISSCSFDGHISVYSLMGGAPPPKTPSKIADSFATDPFAQAPATQTRQPEELVVLKKAPKWLRRPVGASFCFGGKLVTFEHDKPAAGQPVGPQVVRVSQVVTETELVARSTQLEAAVSSNQFVEFCAMKVDNSDSDEDNNIWRFLQVHFEDEPRQRYLQLLGYDQAELANRVAELSAAKPAVNASNGDIGLNEQMAELNTSSPSDDGEGSSMFDNIASQAKAVEEEEKPLQFSKGNDCEGLVSRALLMADFPAAVEVCLHHERLAEAIILAIAGGSELLRNTQERFFKSQTDSLSRLISSVVTRKHELIMRTCDLTNWREALALALTYAKPDEFSKLCDILGERLERESTLAWNACLCYICAGNVDRLVQCWSKISTDQNSPLALQALVEKVMLLRHAVSHLSGTKLADVSGGLLAEKMSSYAEMLAGEGSLTTAAGYLGNSTELQLAALRDRLYTALGQPMQQKPYQVYDVRPEGSPLAPAPQPRASTHSQVSQRQRTNSGFHQAHAGTFQTTTTPTSNYYTSTSYSTSQCYNQQTSSTYSNSIAPSNPYAPAYSAAQPAGVVNKGPLAQKYPSHSQPQYTTPYSSYSTDSNIAPAQTTQLYDPTAMATSQTSPGAPVSCQQPQQEQQPQIPAFQEAKPAGPWNDPPLLARKKKDAQSYEAPAAITAPIAGVPDQGPPGAPNYNQYYNPQQYQQQDTQPVAPPPEPPKPVVKAPIPAEHQALHDVFESLTEQCLASAANPQMKRKLEDVLRKLETLYDKLRTNALSGPVTMGLHQIVQAIRQYDYQTGMAYHTQMVSNGNFSEISSFMPGIKILLQTASQLQVYMQQ